MLMIDRSWVRRSLIGVPGGQSISTLDDDLFRGDPQVLRHVGVVRREFSDQLGVLILEPCPELIYLGLLFMPGADDACKDARLADVRDERLNLCS